VVIAGAVAAWLALRPAHAPRLLVGVDDDTLKWTADPLNARLTELARTEQAARATHVVLAVFGFARDTPKGLPAQARFCAYARSSLALVPDAHAVVIWNEANSPAYWSGTPAQYAALLARCYDALHHDGLTVLDSTASAHAPEAFLRAAAAWLRASGRRRPLVDAFGHNPYPAGALEPPTAVHAPGFVGEGDYTRFVHVLHSAFGGTPEIWYLEDGFQPAVQTAAAKPLQRRRERGDDHTCAACSTDRTGNSSRLVPAERARVLQFRARRRDAPRGLAVWAHLARRSSQARCRRLQSSGAASRVRLSIDSTACAGSVGSRRVPVRPASSA